MATKAAKKKPTPPERPTYKYGVPELAEKLDIAPESTRLALRKHKVKKADGNVYGWDSQTEFLKVVAALKTPSKKPAAAKKKAPAKKKPAKKTPAAAEE